MMTGNQKDMNTWMTRRKRQEYRMTETEVKDDRKPERPTYGRTGKQKDRSIG